MHIFLFDIDGTLIHAKGAGHAAFYQTLREDFGIGDLAGRVEFSGRSDRAIASDLFRVHGIDDSAENWRRFVDGITRRLDVTLPAKNGRVLPGVVELLDQLTARGDVPLGLLTGNVARGAEKKLRHFRLDHYFAFGSFGDEHPERDDIARAAIGITHRHLQGLASANGHELPTVDALRFTVIGDTPNDVRCARAIGATAVAVATGGIDRPALAATKPDLLLDDLSDPQPLLQLIA
jgi:phosphoglycolate phosphatase-like HAD superfamily hydrolase